jgi:hemerythrin-like domain-containing protein
MKKIKYLEDELKSIDLLLRMLQKSSEKIDNGKEVPPWMLKENMELLQIFVDGAYMKRESTILERMENKGINVPLKRVFDEHKTLRKYQKFLQEVIEAYDLGYRGAMEVIPQYCRDYIHFVENHINLVNETIRKSEDSMKNIDKELLKELETIDANMKRMQQKGINRMEILMKELRKVAA